MRRILPWILLVGFLAIGGGILIGRNYRGADASRQITAVQPKAEPSPARQDDTTQEVAALQQTVKDLQQTVKDAQSAYQRAADEIGDLRRQLSAEQGDRKLLSEQVGALSARVDDLNRARAEAPQPAKKRGSTR